MQDQCTREAPVNGDVAFRLGGITDALFRSLSDRQEAGIMINTGARRTGGRRNLDQQLGTKLTVAVGVDVNAQLLPRSRGGNDNSAPAIYRSDMRRPSSTCSERLPRHVFVNSHQWRRIRHGQSVWK